MNMNELPKGYKLIHGFENYAINREGVVYNIKYNRYNRGCNRISLRKNGKTYRFFKPQIVRETFWKDETIEEREKYYHPKYNYYCTNDARIFNLKGREIGVRQRPTTQLVRLSHKGKKVDIAYLRFLYECYNNCLLPTRAHIFKINEDQAPTKDNLWANATDFIQKQDHTLGWYKYQVAPKKSDWRITEETKEGIVTFYPSYASIEPKSKREAIRRINIVKLPYIQGTYKKSLITIKRKNN